MLLQDQDGPQEFEPLCIVFMSLIRMSVHSCLHKLGHQRLKFGLVSAHQLVHLAAILPHLRTGRSVDERERQCTVGTRGAGRQVGSPMRAVWPSHRVSWRGACLERRHRLHTALGGDALSAGQTVCECPAR